MNGANEYASNDRKSFDWSKLPAGVYEWKNGELVQVDDDYAVAADKVTTALRKLLNAVSV